MLPRAAPRIRCQPTIEAIRRAGLASERVRVLRAPGSAPVSTSGSVSKERWRGFRSRSGGRYQQRAGFRVKLAQLQRPASVEQRRPLCGPTPIRPQPPTSPGASRSPTSCEQSWLRKGFSREGRRTRSRTCELAGFSNRSHDWFGSVNRRDAACCLGCRLS